MKLFREIRLQIRRFFAPVLILLMYIYVIYHTFSGERGIMAWYHLNKQVGQLELENLALSEQERSLDRKVKRLSGETIDHDYIDEQIRRNLPMAHPNEQIIYIDE